MIDLAVMRRVAETFGHAEHRKLFAEAADEIERLRAENDKLEKELERCQSANLDE